MNKKTVLITGCSSGIGEATARLLQDNGFHVIATARQKNDVLQLQAAGFNAMQLDVSDSESIHKAVKEILAQSNNQLYGLVNNAGYGGVGAVEDLSRDMLRRQFETNVFGLIELSNLLLPTMRQHGSGRIINLSSILGLVSFPYRGAYNASKYAVEALSDALRMETLDSGIAVSLIEPGPIKTQFRQNALEQFEENIDKQASVHHKNYQKIYDGFKNRKKDIPFTLPPEAVAKKVLHALTAKKPKARYYVTTPTYVLAFAKRLLPTCIMDRLLLRIQ